MPSFLRVENLKKVFFQNHKEKIALYPISFSIYQGETLAVVGESGSGKTTLARVLLKLLPPTSGSVYYQEKDLFSLPPKELKRLRRDLQMIFQNPFASLNPCMSVQDLLEEPFHIHEIPYNSKEIQTLLDLVALPISSLRKFPHEFSGGQRQRIAIARALTLRPSFLVCDEALSALDISIQTQILDLLLTLKKEKKLTYLFISHNLAQVKYLADRILVMYQGQMVELQENYKLFSSPLHPYTQKLLEAAQSLEIAFS